MVDRYEALMSPFYKASSRTRIFMKILRIWILSIFLASPTLFLYNFRWVPDKTHGIKPYCTARHPSYTFLNFFEDNILLKIGKKYFPSLRDFYVFTTLFYQYTIPLAYLTHIYTKMAFKLSAEDSTCVNLREGWEIAYLE